MILAWVIVLLVIGSVAFHFLSPWYFTEIASNWGTIDTTINITFWVCGAVFVIVNLFMAWCIVKYRYDENRRSEYSPENKKLEVWLTGITAVGVVAMLAPGLLVWAEFVTVPDDAWEFEAIGQQWHWSFRTRGEDGQFGAVSAALITNENPFGMNPEDPAGLDDVLIASQVMHIPLNKPVKVNLRSKDVLHNFAVAQFRVKMDLVPGLESYLWLTPTRTGEFEILCQELCGIGHFVMRGMVVVDEQADYESWLASNPTWADVQARKPGDPVAGQAAYAVCTACHGASGEGNPALNSPKIAGQGAWYLRRQIGYFKSGARGAHPDDVYGQQMAPMVATLANDQAVEDVIAYIQTLPDNPAPTTVVGDLARGARTYVVCGNCHGLDGQGIQALNAPRQAGMSDWYLQTQLHNFKNGVRGRHPGDMYGSQMADMAAILSTDEAVNNVIAYINSLPGPVASAAANDTRPATVASASSNDVGLED
jgi:cytochrome c oxidase subunit 2